jgi:hypothetical protein
MKRLLFLLFILCVTGNLYCVACTSCGCTTVESADEVDTALQVQEDKDMDTLESKGTQTEQEDPNLYNNIQTEIMQDAVPS